jgi:hypothetical protein
VNSPSIWGWSIDVKRTVGGTYTDYQIKKAQRQGEFGVTTNGGQTAGSCPQTGYSYARIEPTRCQVDTARNRNPAVRKMKTKAYSRQLTPLGIELRQLRPVQQLTAHCLISFGHHRGHLYPYFSSSSSSLHFPLPGGLASCSSNVRGAVPPSAICAGLFHRRGGGGGGIGG